MAGEQMSFGLQAAAKFTNQALAVDGGFSVS